MRTPAPPARGITSTLISAIGTVMSFHMGQP